MELIDGQNWHELAPGIVVIDNVGSGMGYIDDIEMYVKLNQLKWVPHNKKVIEEDIGKKSMDTMYIKNIRRWGLRVPDQPSKEELFHEKLFTRFERDFTFAYQKYMEDYKVTCEYKEDYEILKYGAGHYFIDHVDDGLFMTRKVSVVYYFNDDYVGGEIVFPRFDVEIKPKAGQLLLFPASYVYNHNVNEIKEGTRYSMVNWLK